MYEIHFCGSSYAEYGLYNYRAAGSVSQVIEGACIKSMQIPMLKYKEWLVLFKRGDVVVSRAIAMGKII